MVVGKKSYLLLKLQIKAIYVVPLFCPPLYFNYSWFIEQRFNGLIEGQDYN